MQQTQSQIFDDEGLLISSSSFFGNQQRSSENPLGEGISEEIVEYYS
jgi:hypothetical protein